MVKSRPPKSLNAQLALIQMELALHDQTLETVYSQMGTGTGTGTLFALLFVGSCVHLHASLVAPIPPAFLIDGRLHCALFSLVLEAPS